MSSDLKLPAHLEPFNPAKHDINDRTVEFIGRPDSPLMIYCGPKTPEDPIEPPSAFSLLSAAANVTVSSTVHQPTATHPTSDWWDLPEGYEPFNDKKHSKHQERTFFYGRPDSPVLMRCGPV